MSGFVGGLRQIGDEMHGDNPHFDRRPHWSTKSSALIPPSPPQGPVRGQGCGKNPAVARQVEVRVTTRPESPTRQRGCGRARKARERAE